MRGVTKSGVGEERKEKGRWEVPEIWVKEKKKEERRTDRNYGEV